VFVNVSIEIICEKIWKKRNLEIFSLESTHCGNAYVVQPGCKNNSTTK
jgi:hypothetical protein